MVRVSITNILVPGALLTLAVLACACGAAAQSKFAVLHHFRGGRDGANPQMILIAGNSGAFYGTTAGGWRSRHGVQADSDPARSNLDRDCAPSFRGWCGWRYSRSRSARGKDGALYGTTLNGGNSNCPQACGVVFKVDQGGSEPVLYSFTGANSDAANPGAGVSFDQNGNRFGTGEKGGRGLCTRRRALQAGRGF
jgi:uncharacterized repeat protein (TIGR03803 family)